MTNNNLWRRQYPIGFRPMRKLALHMRHFAQLALRIDNRALIHIRCCTPSLCLFLLHQTILLDYTEKPSNYNQKITMNSYSQSIFQLAPQSSTSVLILITFATMILASASLLPIRVSGTETVSTCQALASSTARLSMIHCESAFFAFLNGLPQHGTKKFTRDHDSKKTLRDGYITCPISSVDSGCNITFDIVPSDGDKPVNIAELGFATLNLLEQCVEKDGFDGGSASSNSGEKPIKITIGHEARNFTGMVSSHTGGMIPASALSSTSATTSTTFTASPSSSRPNLGGLCAGRFHCVS